MAKAQIGFDIGTGELKIAHCAAGAVRQLAVEPLPDNLVREGRILSFDAMADFIKQTARKHRISGRECAVVLPAGHAFLRRMTMPPMTVEQLRVNLPFEFRDYLTMGKDKYFYDYAINQMQKDGAGAPVEMDVTGAAVEKAIINTYSEMFRRAGFHLTVAAPVECAYTNLIRAQRAGAAEEEREYCILDLGHAATRVHIFTEDRFEATRVIEMGAGTVDAAIADALSVDEHVARSYKEANHNGAQELESVKNVCAEIAVEIMKAVHFYGFNNRESNLRHAYYCGGGGKIPALMQAISGAVDLTMHSVEELLPPADPAQSLFCASAIGIAMQLGGAAL